MNEPDYKFWTTEEGQEQIRDWIKEGLLDKEIAERMDIQPATLAQWKRRYKEINDSFSKRSTYVDYHKEEKDKDLSQRGKRDGELTVMQKLFCDYYIDSRNVVKSYIKAFYDSQGKEYTKSDMKSIQTKAYQLRKNKKVKKYIDQVIKDRRESDAMQPDDIVLRLTEMINNPASDANTVLKAMDMLGKHYKMFNQSDDANKASEVTINLTNLKQNSEDEN